MKRKSNKFAGADDIYLTRKSICVKSVSSRKNKDGVYTVVEKKKYYPKTKKNLNQAKAIHGYLRRK